MRRAEIYKKRRKKRQLSVREAKMSLYKVLRVHAVARRHARMQRVSFTHTRVHASVHSCMSVGARMHHLHPQGTVRQVQAI